MEETTPPHKRRVRYKGKNPRKFEDRYKEHNPDKYAADVEHIVAKGNTPAGSHRPICVEEILQVLDLKPGELCLDATLGYGGHSREILKQILPGGRLFAIDVDPIELPKTQARLAAMGFGEDVFLPRSMNFASVRTVLSEAGEGFDAILADLGVSSMQLDNPARGFSYKTDGPLDLRLNPKKGKPASELIPTLSNDMLEQILFEYADEPHARHIAYTIKAARQPQQTTKQLAELITTGLKQIKPKLSESQVKKSLQRTFMALRIAVNEELNVLDRFLQVLPYCLKPEGRVAILTFHSGEDRRVKKAFALGQQDGVYSSISTSPVLPSPEECRSNPRASCAKLRWAIRSDNPS